MTNISELCYDFIKQNTDLFDLSKYDNNHSINLELLDKYVSKQTCSNEYFKLLHHIYKQATYIDCETFIQRYTSNINELNETFNDKEIIVVFPYLDVNKSNFFLTLYFLYMFNVVLSKKINYVFSYTTKNLSKKIYKKRCVEKCCKHFRRGGYSRPRVEGWRVGKQADRTAQT